MDEEEEKVEFSAEDQENISPLSQSTATTTTMTSEPVQLPSCMYRSSVVKTDDSVILHNPPSSPQTKKGLQEDEVDKKQDNHKRISNVDRDEVYTDRPYVVSLPADQ
jgi:hypothetical protein